MKAPNGAFLYSSLKTVIKKVLIEAFFAHRMLCVLLSYLFLVGPEAFHYFAQADVQYSQLTTAAWGNAGDTITYGYDDNGSMTSKVTNDGSSDTESVTYRYNLQNRLSRVITDSDPANSNNHDVSVVDYSYNTAGIRISKCSFTVAQTYLDTTDEQTYATDITTTDYLVDPYNHTGYAQVLQETTGATVTYYTIGDDVIAQTTDGVTQYLLYDGHGSTRQLVATDGSTINDSYSYDAYGVMLGDSTTPYPAQSAATSLLYAGEQYDANMDQYYLRARYYNQNNGTFNRVDPYSGNTQDPQSLHKYAYVHNNPVNAIDPTGMFSIVSVLVATITVVSLAAIFLPPAFNILRSAKRFIDLADFNNFVRGLANKGVISQEAAFSVQQESMEATTEIIKSAVGSAAVIANELAECYAYSLAFSAVTQVAMKGIKAGVKLTQKGQAILKFGRANIHGHHPVFKCAVKKGLRQRKFWLPTPKHVGAPDGLHYRIAQSREFRHLQPTSNRTMVDIIGAMGKQQWLDELGECYKWLETRDSEYKGIYKAYEKSVQWIGGAAGLIDG